MEINNAKDNKLGMEDNDNGYRLNYQNNTGFLPGTINTPNLSWNAMQGFSGPNLGYDHQNLLTQFPKIGSFLPFNLTDIQAGIDQGFIERAAKYSRFNGANASAVLGSIGKDVIDQGKRKDNLIENGGKGMEKDGIEGDDFGGGGSGEEEGIGSVNAKKRKRLNQEPETNQGKRDQQPPNANNTREISGKEEKGEEKKPSENNNNHRKDGSEAGNKEEYVHVRARRGQATNSHSLAERVRREKISERMKYLQDLVPGCNKVTGKAVMLDEIINYVQSLQRQVEFLSMKLSAINPRLDFNIESILSKSLFNPNMGVSSTMGYIPNHAQIQLLHSQQNLIHASIASTVDSSDALRRISNPQLDSNAGPKEPLPQMPNAWDGDYQNAMQVAYRDLNN